MAIYRTKHKQNFLGNSFCDYCKKPLKAIDLIPLFSFVLFKGKSRCCHKNLSIYMPVIELITGIVFLTLVNLYFPSLYTYFNRVNLEFIFLLVISPPLIFIFFYDLKYFEIPVLPVVFIYLSWILYKIFDFCLLNYSNQLIKTSSPIGDYLVKSGYFSQQVNYFYIDTGYTLGFALFTFLFFLLLFIITKGRGMGFGDVYFAPSLALIAYYPLSPIFLASSFIVGAVFGVILILIKNKTLKTAVPFGPFLIIGLVIALTFGKMYINL